VTDVELSPKNFKQWLFGLYLDKERYSKFEEVQKLFNAKPFEFGELGFSHDKGQTEIMVKKGAVRLPISRMGSGLQQILFLIATVVVYKNKLLGIEELEINLSPKAQKEIFEILKKYVNSSPNVLDQVIITSHSDYFEDREDVKCFAVELNQQESSSKIGPWEEKNEKGILWGRG